MTVPGEKTVARVTAIQEGHEYEFRIVAQNKAGKSDPSDPSKSVIANPRFCKLSFRLFVLKKYHSFSYDFILAK